jgi:ASC-1-like (ASCH) protein
MIYDFWVQEPYKSFLLNWKKTVEWRLNKGKFKNLEIGDVLEFDTWERFKVLWKREYVSFFKMMESEWVEKVLPDYADIQKWVEEVYYKFYSPKLEKEYWVVAVEVGLL